MSNLRLNQVTLGAKDMAASVLFYQNLGLQLIVDSAPDYCRFEFPEQAGGREPATLSLHSVEEDWTPPSEWPLIYFEVDDVPHYLQDKNIKSVKEAELMSYLWVEADIIDPSGNRIRIYHAGENRRFPPWRVNAD